MYTHSPSGKPIISSLDSDSLSLSRVFLQFDGVNNAFYVWVNGKPVGYSQDSCLPAEFDVSNFLQEGKNLISVQVSCPKEITQS